MGAFRQTCIHNLCTLTAALNTGLIYYINGLFHFAVFICTLPELSRACQTLPAVTHIQRRRKLFLFLFQALPQMSHLHCHKPDQKDLSISPIFGCKKTHESILTCTQTLIHTETHTVHPNTFKQSVLSCNKQTHQGPSKRAFKFGQMAYHSSHPSTPLWVWNMDPGSAYCSQNTFSTPYTTLAEVVA